MSLRGTIENGRLVLEDGARLPNGTKVDVSVRTKKSKRTGAKPDSLLRLASHAVNTGIRDLADEHDHYLYGTPKRAKSKARRKSKRSSR